MKSLKARWEIRYASSFFLPPFLPPLPSFFSFFFKFLQERYILIAKER